MAVSSISVDHRDLHKARQEYRVLLSAYQCLNPSLGGRSMQEHNRHIHSLNLHCGRRTYQAPLQLLHGACNAQRPTRCLVKVLTSLLGPSFRTAAIHRLAVGRTTGLVQREKSCTRSDHTIDHEPENAPTCPHHPSPVPCWVGIGPPSVGMTGIHPHICAHAGAHLVAMLASLLQLLLVAICVRALSK